jgi:hypothetical protein
MTVQKVGTLDLILCDFYHGWLVYKISEHQSPSLQAGDNKRGFISNDK